MDNVVFVCWVNGLRLTQPGTARRVDPGEPFTQPPRTSGTLSYTARGYGDRWSHP
jgi:hypothetical protein